MGAPRLWLSGFATLLFAGLQVRLFLTAGGLWRDEVNTLNTALAPGLTDVWRGLEFESAPVLWPLIVRGWCALGPCDSDPWLRGLGLLGASCLPVAAWWVARRLGLSAPLLLLVLVALNPEVLRWSASLRAFGLGSALVLVVFEAIFRLSDAPTRRNLVWATGVTLLCVHALYYNAIFVLAICGAAAVLNLLRRRMARTLPVVGVGALSALSLLPYLPILEAQYLGAEGFEVERLWWKLGGAMAAQHALAPWAWLGASLAAVAAGIAWARTEGPGDRARDVALFAGVAGVAAVALFSAFLVGLGYATQAWYYVGCLALCALALDLVLAPRLASSRSRVVEAVLAVALVLLALPALWRASEMRFTNVDVLASRVATMARPGDFAVVQPWFLAISYERYADPDVPWMQLPPLDDASVHRWDLLAQHIASRDPLETALERAGETLRQGGRVFVVRLFPPLPRGAPARVLPPDPEGIRSAALYDAAFSTQLDVFLREHAVRVTRVPQDETGPVSVFEAAWLQVAYGRVD